MPRSPVKHRAAGAGSNRLALRAAAPYNRLMLLALPPLLRPAATSPAWGQPARELRVGVTGIPAIPDPASAMDGTTPLIARQGVDPRGQHRPPASPRAPLTPRPSPCWPARPSRGSTGPGATGGPPGGSAPAPF